MVSAFPSSVRSWSIALLVLAASPVASAQFGNAWLTLTPKTDVLVGPTGGVSDLTANTDEKDFAVGDLNRDGWPDLVVVKSVQVTFVGPREGRLLLNEKGKLVDRTDTHGVQSFSAALGDLGLKQAVESSDVEIGDLNGDGWDDVVGVQYDLTNNTAPSAKRLTHPRVYMNLGNHALGYWIGLRHEDSRIPQLSTVGGVNGAVRFMDGALGDVDHDGDLDLYFSDFDTNENGHPEPSILDLNDRLLINDGNGFFTDQTIARFATAGMWSSAFGTQSEVFDLNADGKRDIVKISTLTDSPNRVEVIYNDVLPGTAPNFVGGFDAMKTISPGENYAFAVSDLNNDGRLDVAVGDAGSDHFLFNQGNDATGQVVWSAQKNLSWLTGSADGGFLGAVFSHDYDLDGWNDVITADVIVDLAGCNRRPQIYHNRGGTPGGSDVELVEEKQQSGSGGWFGAVGWTFTGPKGVNDIASIDYDRDGDLDIVLGRCVGTDVWRNETNPVTCQPTIAPISKGTASLSICGAPLYTGLSAKITVSGGPQNGTALLLVSQTPGTIPSYGGNVMAPFVYAALLPLDSQGLLVNNISGGGGTPTGVTAYVQALLVPLGGLVPAHITNIVAVTIFD